MHYRNYNTNKLKKIVSFSKNRIIRMKQIMNLMIIVIMGYFVLQEMMICIDGGSIELTEPDMGYQNATSLGVSHFTISL